MKPKEFQVVKGVWVEFDGRRVTVVYNRCSDLSISGTAGHPLRLHLDANSRAELRVDLEVGRYRLSVTTVDEDGETVFGVEVQRPDCEKNLEFHFAVESFDVDVREVVAEDSELCSAPESEPPAT